MFWFIYILSIVVFTYLLIISFKSRSKRLIIFIGFIILLTPAQIEIGSSDYAPAVFTFIFNSLLEQDYSLRVLRPIFLSLPLSFFVLGLVTLLRKRFS